ncbi:MAG: stage II sporulation protein R [Muribaculaceae bacterium]|nr:stage II sporulation protein R [Roseburia sp.]MCM1430646.1 stage II sporulation protein R [Muribaculaceae bacterium]MCM1491913.1 stage II sporulation protein R [Muribaculaceae bacterium]
MKKTYIITVMLLLLGSLAWHNAATAAALTGELRDWQSRELQPSIAGKILRLHILANSDSAEDQSVKIKVRDAVGRELAPLLAEADSLAGTEAIVGEQLAAVVETAETVLAENGCSYGAGAKLVTTEFPEKTYGAFTFPEGEYRALEIELGNGGGHNWWCVLYPNMCFQGTVYEASADGGEVLREVLSPEEYGEVLDSQNYEIRWKFLEYFR